MKTINPLDALEILNAAVNTSELALAAATTNWHLDQVIQCVNGMRMILATIVEPEAVNDPVLRTEFRRVRLRVHEIAEKAYRRQGLKR